MGSARQAVTHTAVPHSTYPASITLHSDTSYSLYLVIQHYLCSKSNSLHSCGCIVDCPLVKIASFTSCPDIYNTILQQYEVVISGVSPLAIGDPHSIPSPYRSD